MCLFLYNNIFVMSEDIISLSLYLAKQNIYKKEIIYILYTRFSYGWITAVFCYFVHTIRASVDALCRDGTAMRGDAQNPKSFQAPRM